MNEKTHHKPYAYSRLRLALGLSGLIPFVGLAYIAIAPFHLSDLPFSHPVSNSWSHPELEIFIAYSAVILSFLAGTLWGKSMGSDNSFAMNNIVLLSNIIALTAWLVLILELINLNRIALALLAVGFASVLFFEYHQREKLYGNLASSYLKYRTLLTTVVIASHLVLLFSDALV